MLGYCSQRCVFLFAYWQKLTVMDEWDGMQKKLSVSSSQYGKTASRHLMHIILANVAYVTHIS